MGPFGPGFATGTGEKPAPACKYGGAQNAKTGVQEKCQVYTFKEKCQVYTFIHSK